MWWQQSRTSGRNATPTVAILDSQSAQAAQRGASIDPQGDDAGKKVSGRKRHILRVGSGPSAWMEPSAVCFTTGVGMLKSRHAQGREGFRLPIGIPGATANLVALRPPSRSWPLHGQIGRSVVG
jgi:hypothetical protein